MIRGGSGKREEPDLEVTVTVQGQRSVPGQADPERLEESEGRILLGKDLANRAR